MIAPAPLFSVTFWCPSGYINRDIIGCPLLETECETLVLVNEPFTTQNALIHNGQAGPGTLG
jgi:hypothetical protein